MARQPKQNEAGNGGPRVNTIDPDKAKIYLSRIEKLDSERQEVHGTYMNDCKDIKRDVAKVYSDAKSNGIPPKVLEREWQLRLQQKKVDELLASLDEDDLYLLQRLRDAWNEPSMGARAARPKTPPAPLGPEGEPPIE
jgi:uncharacterized protein (UPF0335 family)